MVQTTQVFPYERSIVKEIEFRLKEPRSFIQVVSGPRQTGKTTAIQQALENLNLPYRFSTADRPSSQTLAWLESEWIQARTIAESSSQPFLLVIDEIQSIEKWSSVVKALWDEDTWSKLDLRVLLSGSSSLLLDKGLSESLAGRFEITSSTHWSYTEMRDAFGYNLEDFLLYGGYPGSSILIEDENRWTRYINDSIIETSLSKDVLQMEDIRKPALLRSLFLLGSQYSAQEVSYRKLLGQLDDKGNATTIAHYLELLSKAGLLCGIQKFDEKVLKTRKSSPRLMVFDTSLMTATSHSMQTLLEQPQRGHLIESAVGAYLLAQSTLHSFEVFWWRENNAEVDFVLRQGERLFALEVKSGRKKSACGLEVFRERFPAAVPLIIGERNCSLEDFLSGKIQLF